MSVISRITKPYRIYSNFTNVDLPNYNEAYQEIVSLTGLGIVYSSMLRFNNKSIMLKMEIDGTQSFEINLGDLKDMIPNGVYSAGISFPITYDDQKDLFVFNPSLPILYRESFKFYAKANSSSNNRDFEAAIVEYTVE